MKYDVIIIGGRPRRHFFSLGTDCPASRPEGSRFRSRIPAGKAALPHQRKESRSLSEMPGLRHHERLWRSRRFFRWKI